MSRTTLILIVILVVVLAGAGAWWYFNQDKVSQVLNRTTNTVSNTNTVANTNLGPVNGNLSVEQKGDQDVDFTITVNDVEVHFSSVSKLENFAGLTAAEGQVFLVVYFDALPIDKVLTVQDGLAQRVEVLYRGGATKLTGLKVASDTVSGDRGYVKFAVADDATDLKLKFADNPREYELPY